MILEMAGHDVRVVHDGQSAVSAAQSFRPARPCSWTSACRNWNGYDVARALRQEPWGAGITLIALTGWGQKRSDRQKAMKCGLQIIISTKPVDPAMLESWCYARLLESSP